jgi:hypothetical protein
MALPPLSRVRWARTYRIIPSRYPPVDAFERVAPPEDWGYLAEIEGMTNDRLRDEIGEIALVPVAERLSGPGSTPIMAAFTHPGVSRFSGGSYGVYYAGHDQATAVAESAHSRVIFLAATSEAPMRVEMRAYLGRVEARLHDVRRGWPQIHDPDDYSASQALAAELRGAGSVGIVYNSVRRAGGECIAAFKTTALARCAPHSYTLQGSHFFYDWDGSSIRRYLVVGETRWRAIPH